MSAKPIPPGGAPESDDADRNSQGASGEGAGSALEAMLKKRQMRVDPSDSSVAPQVQQPDGGAADHKTEE